MICYLINEITRFYFILIELFFFFFVFIQNHTLSLEPYLNFELFTNVIKMKKKRDATSDFFFVLFYATFFHITQKFMLNFTCAA